MGEEYFEQNHNFDDLREPNIPLYFSFVFSTFIELYNFCKDGITWTDIENYAIIRKIDFTQSEIDLLLKCNCWASGKINEMKKEE